MYLDNDDNKITGAVGALIGALLGTVIWCFIGSFGVISYIGGFMMCLGVFGGYYLLGKGASKAGLLICAVVLLISVYIAVRMKWSIDLYRAFDGETPLWKCFVVVVRTIDALEGKGAFFKELAISYGITFLGGFGLMHKLGVVED